MDDKKLIGIAVITSLATCGLLAPVWFILLLTYYAIKAFRYKPKEKPKPKMILPDNSFADDWQFIIRERVHSDSSD